MAKAPADQYTTTAQQDVVLAAYGEDLAVAEALVAALADLGVTR